MGKKRKSKQRGDKKKIYEIARRSYFADENLGVQKGENDFLHTENFILVDKNRHIRGIYDGTVPEKVDKLMEDMEILLKELWVLKCDLVNK